MAKNLINSNDIEVEATGNNLQLELSDAVHEQLDALDDYVVDSMAGNEQNKAPSVKSVKDYVDTIDITSHFSSSYNVNTLKAIYYPRIKKVEVTFFISQIPTSAGWTNFITIDDSTYYSASETYDVCYSTNAASGAVGILENTGYIRGYKNALFGGTLIYYTN